MTHSASHMELEGMEFFAYHGCYRDETLNGNYFRIDLTLGTDLFQVGSSDRLEDTIDYVQVYELIKKEMDIRAALLENVASRILRTLFDHFISLQSARIKISKIHPDMGGSMEKFSVVMEQARTT